MLSFTFPFPVHSASHAKAKAEDAARQDRRAIVNSDTSGPCECGAEKTMLLLPCAHQKVCWRCALDIDTCPNCSTTITQAIRKYPMDPMDPIRPCTLPKQAACT